jgi:hypothetical protein
MLFFILTHVQKKHELLIDSLPYIDKELDDSATKNYVERYFHLI